MINCCCVVAAALDVFYFSSAQVDGPRPRPCPETVTVKQQAARQAGIFAPHTRTGGPRRPQLGLAAPAPRKKTRHIGLMRPCTVAKPLLPRVNGLYIKSTPISRAKTT